MMHLLIDLFFINIYIKSELLKDLAPYRIEFITTSFNFIVKIKFNCKILLKVKF